VLFLRQVHGRWYLTAMEQSRYALRTVAGSAPTMHRVLHSALYTRDEHGGLVEFVEPSERRLKPLADFRAQMAALAPTGAQ
jgi:hypothetical protein